MAFTPSPKTVQEEPLPVLDFFGQPLAEGDRIAFTSKGDDQLYVATIALIGREHSTREQLVVQSGHLTILKGTHLRASGGKPEQIRFLQVVRRPAEDGS